MGVINKKKSWYKVPDKDPYKFEFNKAIVIVLSVLVVVAMAFVMFGCNPYKKILTRSPKTSSDTSAVIKVAKGIIKPSAPKIIPGKTVIKKIPIEKIKKVLDTALIERISDSLLNTTISQAENYNNNIDELIRDCDKAVKKAIQTGYKQALDSFSTIQLPNDTIPNCEETELELSDCEQQGRLSETAKIKAEAERDVYKEEIKGYKKNEYKKWLFPLIALIAGAVLGRFIKFTPTKISA